VVFSDNFDDRLDFLANTQGVEFDFEDIVKFANFRLGIA